MARFETWGDVARLFIAAAGVGVLLILLLTAEARKLEEREEALVAEEEEAESDKVVAEAGDISALTGLRTVWSKLAQFIRFFISNTLITGDVFILSQDYHICLFISADATFRKISFKSAQYTIQDKVSPQRNSEPGEAKTRRKREVAPDEDYYSSPIRETLQEDTSPYSDQVSDLGSALLSSALGGHKVERTKENTS